MLEFNDKKILSESGNVSNAQMEEKVKLIYESFDSKRKSYEALNVDEEDIKEIEQKIKSRNKK